MSVKPCPTPQQLIDLCIGNLPDDEVAAVAEHIDECPTCRESAEALERLPIPFIDYHLRGAASGAANYSTEPRLRHILAVAKELQTGIDG